MPINCRQNVVLFNWVPGLGSGPDVPHTENSSRSTCKTEGIGVGITKEPSVCVRNSSVQLGLSFFPSFLTLNLDAEVYNLCFRIQLSGQECVWETLMYDGCLIIEIPNNLLPEGSKESFVILLEYAEDILKCQRGIICFRKKRVDQVALVRTFMFLGFRLVPPGEQIIPNINFMPSHLLYLSYPLDPTGSGRSYISEDSEAGSNDLGYTDSE